MLFSQSDYHLFDWIEIVKQNVDPHLVFVNVSIMQAFKDIQPAALFAVLMYV